MPPIRISRVRPPPVSASLAPAGSWKDDDIYGGWAAAAGTAGIPTSYVESLDTNRPARAHSPPGAPATPRESSTSETVQKRLGDEGGVPVPPTPRPLPY